MRSLLDFIVRHSFVFLFILLETLSLVLLFGLNDRQNAAFITSANSVSGTVFEWRTGISQYFGLRKENTLLADENARLREQLYALTDSARQQYADSIGSGSVIVARVIDNSVRRDDNYITINKGRKDGIEKGMGVYNSCGVVGVVMICGKHYSVVLSVLNGKTSISCKIKGTDNFGFLEWTGGDPYVAQLKDVPYHSNVARGDTVVTSGFSSVFPDGIPVGVISGVERLSNGYTLKITVRLAAEMSNLGWVYVHSKAQDEEIVELFQQIR